MRDANAKTFTTLVQEMIDRRLMSGSRKLYYYRWYHQHTGNSGIRTIYMPSCGALEAWIKRWNHSNFARGWIYSLP